MNALYIYVWSINFEKMDFVIPLHWRFRECFCYFIEVHDKVWYQIQIQRQGHVFWKINSFQMFYFPCNDEFKYCVKALDNSNWLIFSDWKSSRLRISCFAANFNEINDWFALGYEYFFVISKAFFRLRPCSHNTIV